MCQCPTVLRLRSHCGTVACCHAGAHRAVFGCAPRSGSRGRPALHRPSARRLHLQWASRLYCRIYHDAGWGQALPSRPQAVKRPFENLDTGDFYNAQSLVTRHDMRQTADMSCAPSSRQVVSSTLRLIRWVGHWDAFSLVAWPTIRPNARLGCLPAWLDSLIRPSRSLRYPPARLDSLISPTPTARVNPLPAGFTDQAKPLARVVPPCSAGFANQSDRPLELTPCSAGFLIGQPAARVVPPARPDSPSSPIRSLGYPSVRLDSLIRPTRSLGYVCLLRLICWSDRSLAQAENSMPICLALWSIRHAYLLARCPACLPA